MLVDLSVVDGLGWSRFGRGGATELPNVGDNSPLWYGGGLGGKFRGGLGGGTLLLTSFEGISASFACCRSLVPDSAVESNWDVPKASSSPYDTFLFNFGFRLTTAYSSPPTDIKCLISELGMY